MIHNNFRHYFVALLALLCAHNAWGTEHNECEFLRESQDDQGERQWKAATYRSITIGKSTAKELFQKWGKPESTGNWDWDNPKKPKHLLYNYDIKEGLAGRAQVDVETKTGKVISITLSPDELSMKQAVELFGSEYIETRYKFCNCDFGDGAPIFESPDGHLIYIEYRGRGIAMFAGYKGLVNSIQFVDRPVGLKSSQECEKIPECRPKRRSGKRQAGMANQIPYTDQRQTIAIIASRKLIEDHCAFSNSTSKTRVAFGGILSPMQRAP